MTLSAGNDDGRLITGEGPALVATSSKWSRPPLPTVHPKTDNIEFQQLDVDYYVGEMKFVFIVGDLASVVLTKANVLRKIRVTEICAHREGQTRVVAMNQQKYENAGHFLCLIFTVLWKCNHLILVFTGWHDNLTNYFVNIRENSYSLRNSCLENGNHGKSSWGVKCVPLFTLAVYVHHYLHKLV